MAASTPGFDRVINSSGSPFNAVWDLDYFSGSQVFIYIGDIWVDEVTSLQYERRQNKVPLYGYASQLFDATATGQVIVQGSFTINFKEQGYMWAVLRRYGELLRSTSNPSDRQPITASNKTKNTDGTTGHSVSKLTIDDLTREQILQGKATTDTKYNYFLNLAGNTTFDTNTSTDKEFENVMETFENAVWGSSQATYASEAGNPDNQLYNDFDMYVVFGNYQNDMANHTVQKIVGVRLLSQGKVIQIDGRPVQEQYDFIARTLQ